jgi:type I site-specific restriction endonuclease
LRHGHRMTSAEVHELAMSDIEKAEEQLQVISQDRILRAQYEARMKAERDAIAWEQDHIDQWREEGERIGIEIGLRQAILDMSDLLGIAVSGERREWLETLDLGQLEQLRTQLKQTRAWPAS